MVSLAIHEVNGLIGLGLHGTEWSKAEVFCAGAVSLIGQGCVSYNDALQSNAEASVNSVSTLPRPITDYQPLSLSSCSAALPMLQTLGRASDGARAQLSTG